MITWHISRFLRWLVCFWVGHLERYGEEITAPGGFYRKISPDYCLRCMYTSDAIGDWDAFIKFNRPYLWDRLTEWLRGYR